MKTSDIEEFREICEQELEVRPLHIFAFTGRKLCDYALALSDRVEKAETWAQNWKEHCALAEAYERDMEEDYKNAMKRALKAEAKIKELQGSLDRMLHDNTVMQERIKELEAQLDKLDVLKGGQQ